MLFKATYTLLVITIALMLQSLVITAAYGDSKKIPRVLNQKDIERYRTIFDLQTDGNWKSADKLIKRLSSKILMGHVLYQRYMHPTRYRSKYSELKIWMGQYADHPSAWRIYNLAKRRQGKARAPKHPLDTRYPGVTGQAAKPSPSTPPRKKADRQSVATFKANIRRYVRKGNPERAEKRYFAIEARDLLTPHEAANALERIASSHYYHGNDFKARVLAERAINLDPVFEPVAYWIAGLASWRMNDFDAAYDHFSVLGDLERSGSWLSSAGHYWAARAALYLNNTETAHSHLMHAGQNEETFYGLIANRQLGLDYSLDWTKPDLSDLALNDLLKHSAAKRAIALTEVGHDDLADEELRLLWGREGVNVQDALLSFASALNLPAIQIRLGNAGGTGNPAPTAVRYPMPDWQPADGLRLDQAFLYAVVRKESAFRTQVRSYKGASGLMQMMPATASFIAGTNDTLKRNKHRLFEPEYNIALGQQYLEHLLEQDYVEDNLFMLLAAYNAGPGPLLEWRKNVNYKYDPLLFIESIGYYQTRHYIERVMANFWLYRMQLGQPTPSLDAVASGAWPYLEVLDTPDSRKIRERRRARLAGRTRNLFEEE